MKSKKLNLLTFVLTLSAALLLALSAACGIEGLLSVIGREPLTIALAFAFELAKLGAVFALTRGGKVPGTIRRGLLTGVFILTTLNVLSAFAFFRQHLTSAKTASVMAGFTLAETQQAADDARAKLEKLENERTDALSKLPSGSTVGRARLINTYQPLLVEQQALVDRAASALSSAKVNGAQMTPSTALDEAGRLFSLEASQQRTVENVFAACLALSLDPLALALFSASVFLAGIGSAHPSSSPSPSKSHSRSKRSVRRARAVPNTSGGIPSLIPGAV